MTTEQIIWTVVIVVAVLALVGFIVASMRKKSQQDNRARAAELREEADTRAAVIPDAQARAREAEAQAEQARLQAERAEERAQTARGEAAQREAIHEDQVRAADRLDPDVDHRAKDYTPDTAAVTGTHAGERTTHESPDPHPSGASTGTHAGERTEPAPTSHDPETIFDSRTDTTTSGTDTTGTDDHRTEETDGTATTTWSGNPTTAGSEGTPTTAGSDGDHAGTADPDWTDPDQRDGTADGSTGGSHRA